MRTTVIGSYPLSYEELGPDAVVRAVEEQIAAGVELVSDGQTRGDIISIYAGMIEGMELRAEGTVQSGGHGARHMDSAVTGEVACGADRMSGWGSMVAGGVGRRMFISGRISPRDASMLVGDFRLATATARGRAGVKAILTGPVTLAFSSVLDTKVYSGYRDRRLYMDLSGALLEIARELERAGAKHLQLDEPYFSIGVPVLLAREAVENIALGFRGEVALHACGDVRRALDWMLGLKGVRVLSLEFAGAPQNLEVISREKLEGSGKLLGFGCIDTASERVESEEEVLGLLRKGASLVGEENMVAHPDCGLKGLPLEAARRKLRVLCAAARSL
ncbi:MAG: hypothetical protein QXH42_01295 [Thermoplasmata archaeon]